MIARQLLEPLDQRARPPDVGRDDENRVVAGEGADHLRQPRAVERDAEQLRLPGPGAQQHQLLHAVDARQVLGQRALQQRLRRRGRSAPPRAGGW